VARTALLRAAQATPPFRRTLARMLEAQSATSVCHPRQDE